MGLIYLEPAESESPEDFASRCDEAIIDYKKDSPVTSVELQWCDSKARLALFYLDGQKCWTPELSKDYYVAARVVFDKHMHDINE